MACRARLVLALRTCDVTRREHEADAVPSGAIAAATTSKGPKSRSRARVDSAGSTPLEREGSQSAAWLGA